MKRSVFAVLYETYWDAPCPQEFCAVFENFIDANEYVDNQIMQSYAKYSLTTVEVPSPGVTVYSIREGKQYRPSKFIIKEAPYEDYEFEIAMEKIREQKRRSIVEV